MANRFRTPALVALGAVLEIAFLALARLPSAPTFPYLSWMLGAGLVYLIAVGWVLRRPAAAAGATPRGHLRFILFAAVVFRLTLLPLTPSLSHHLGRFHWDGEIQHLGFNPYQYAPRNGLFSPIRPADQRLAHPDIAAFHPPLAELLFRWDYDLFGGLRRQKLLYCAFDLLLILGLVRLLRARGQPAEQVLIYAWSPLAVFEVSGNGHLEPVAALLVLYALRRAGPRPYRAAVALASAAMTQWYALALLPSVLAAAKRRWAGSLAWMLAWSAFLALPFLWMDKHFALGAIAANVRAAAAAAPVFNASLYAVAHAWFGARAAQALAVAVVGAVIAATLWRRQRAPAREAIEPLRAGFLILGALLLVMPQVQPWHLLWLLPLLALWPEAPWLYFAAAAPLAYALPLHPALIWVEYAPVFALLGWQGVRAWAS